MSLSNNEKKLSKRTLLCGASLVAAAIAAPGAYAQQDGDDAQADQRDDRIVVTGSRLAQDSTLTAASPVLAIGADDIKTSGQIDIGALLRESPQLNASLPGSFSAFNGGPLGASRLNLRNLGVERTLVLEDGQRHVPSIEGEATVDVNNISTALLERVEVLTGGASAIYGADAVTGVVNFIMRDGASFDGLEFRSQAGITDKGDADELFFSIANGFESPDGRGSIVFALEFQNTEPLFAEDRDFAGSGRFQMVPNNEATQAAFGVDPKFSNTFVPNLRLPISSDLGIIAISPFESAFFEVFLSDGNPGCRTFGDAEVPTCQVIDNGTLRPYNPGDVFIGPFDASGGDGIAVLPDSQLIWPDSTRGLFQTDMEYEFNEHLNFFLNAKYIFTETQETNQVNGFNDDIPIQDDNPFIIPALQAQLDTLSAEGLDPSIVVSRDTLDLAGRSNPIAERKTFRLVGGFNGEFDDLGLGYEVSFNFGRTDADITSRARVEDRFFAAVDAVRDPDTGEIVCRSELDSTPADYVPPSSPFPPQNPNFGISTFVPGDGQCVPINIMGANTITPEAAEFIFLPTTSQNEIEQRIFQASINGDTEDYLNLPGGPIGFAFGYEWRNEQSNNEPDNLTRSGLTFGTLDDRGGPILPSGGEIEVNEFFAEAQAPILADLPFIERLQINGAYRYSDYDTFGETDTWSLGARWSIVDSLTIRGTISRAVRIPNIDEAFSPRTADFLNAGDDPCNPQFINAGSDFREQNCLLFVDPGFDSTDFLTAFVAGETGGNPNLDPEEADTFTLGAVWRPAGDFGGKFDGLIVTVDYYNIEIDGLIDELDPFDIASNCVDAPTINNQFCEQIDRDPTDGFITGFRSGFVNLAAVETSGVDFRVDYGFDIGDVFEGHSNLGSIDISTNGTWFLENDEIRDVSEPDAVTDVLETLTRPEWIVIGNVDWSIHDFVFGWSVRYESSQLVDGVEPQDLENDPNFVDIQRTGDSFVHDFSVSYFLKDDLEIYGGVNNAFDREPYIGELSRPAGPRGTFFFAGVNATF